MQTGGVIRFIGDSPGIKRALDLCEMVAKDDVTVLLRGETGVGKELLARKIHSASKRGQNPFVIMNCPAITATISESELFGHDKGAFTGAWAASEGILAAADGGTLFMDEIADMDMAVQLKLLRFLNGDSEAREVRRVGSAKIKPVNVRIVAATNQQLLDFVKNGKFRQDLYYRLNPVTIHIPPLRSRREDIPALIKYFAQGFELRNDAEVKLLKHDWPGNVRELENVLRTAKMVAAHKNHDRITVEDVWFADEMDGEEGGMRVLASR